MCRKEGWKEACQATRAISTKSRRELSSSFFFLQGKAPKEIHAILTETLGEHAPSYATVKIWVSQFQRDEFSTCVVPLPGRPKTVTTPEIIEQILDLILEDHHYTSTLSLHYLWPQFELLFSVRTEFGSWQGREIQLCFLMSLKRWSWIHLPPILGPSGRFLWTSFLLIKASYILERFSDCYSIENNCSVFCWDLFLEARARKFLKSKPRSHLRILRHRQGNTKPVPHCAATVQNATAWMSPPPCTRVHLWKHLSETFRTGICVAEGPFCHYRNLCLHK